MMRSLQGKNDQFIARFDKTMKGIHSLFGSMVFNDTVMQARLPENIYKASTWNSMSLSMP